MNKDAGVPESGHNKNFIFDNTQVDATGNPLGALMVKGMNHTTSKKGDARLNKEGIAWFKEKGLDRDNPDWYDLELNMLIQKHTLKDLTVLANMDKLDIILIPRPVQEILNENWQNDPDIYKIRLKARTCRKLDSRDNSQGIYSNKFCR